MIVLPPVAASSVGEYRAMTTPDPPAPTLVEGKPAVESPPPPPPVLAVPGTGLVLFPDEPAPPPPAPPAAPVTL